MEGGGGDDDLTTRLELAGLVEGLDELGERFNGSVLDIATGRRGRIRISSFHR